MSEENVAIVRALAEAFRSRDHERAFEFYDPEIVFDARRTATGAATGLYHGHDGVREYWREWLSAWRDLQFEIDDVLDGGDAVVLLIRDQRQWGRHSGIETTVDPYGIVFTFRDGKVVHWRAYHDPAAALEAAGLAG